MKCGGCGADLGDSLVNVTLCVICVVQTLRGYDVPSVPRTPEADEEASAPEGPSAHTPLRPQPYPKKENKPR